MKLTTEVKSVIWYNYKSSFIHLMFLLFSDADFKLAPLFDGYDRKRLDDHEKELNVSLVTLSSSLIECFVLVP